MRSKIWKRVVAGMVSVSVFSTALSLKWEFSEHRVMASEEEGCEVSLGISGLNQPSEPQDGEEWSGDYVYYGSYGEEPIKWRVLDTTGEAGSSSMPGGILLQSDQVLHSMPFQESESGQADSQWQKSGIREWLQGKDTFLDGSHFSQRELDGVMKTTRDAGESPVEELRSTGLDRDTMFLLDACDVANAAYGYSYEDHRINDGFGQSWWLRSAHAKHSAGAGYVLPGGYLYYKFIFEEGGIAPAFNLDASNVLFMSPAEQEESGELLSAEGNNEWKLTLSEGPTLEVTGGVSRHQDEISVPYGYRGNAADKISVMITDGEFKESDTEVECYETVSEDEIGKDGTVNFELPEEYDEEGSFVYLLAEQSRGENRTDYASEPVLLQIPPAHEHQLEWRFDEDAHWKVCTAPDCDLQGEDGIMDYDDHDFGENEGIVIKEPSPEEGGLEEILCDVCGNMIRQPIPFEEPEESEEPEETEEPEEHTYAEQVIQPATCVEAGRKRIFCTVEGCGESWEEVIPALSASLRHTFGNWIRVSEPTAEREGLSKRTCTVCGVSETKSIPKQVLSHTHNYNGDVWTTDENSHWNQCSCGAKKDVEAHGWDKGKIIKRPGRKKEGQVRLTCKVCDRTTVRAVKRIGTKFTSGGYKYRITGCKNGRLTAAVIGFARGKDARRVNIPGTAYCQGVAFTVTEVADRAFAFNNKIKDIVIGDSVERIGDFAFYLSQKVEHITIGTGMKEFGQHIFCHTYKLKSLTIKSKKLVRAVTGVLHGGMDQAVIKVPRNRVKWYRKEVFETHATRVKGLSE